jgi:hypothetical protein
VSRHALRRRHALLASPAVFQFTLPAAAVKSVETNAGRLLASALQL